MSEWCWEDDYGRFSIRADGGVLTFIVEATIHGEREMGFRSGTSTRTIESLEGEVPMAILKQVAAFLRET